MPRGPAKTKKTSHGRARGRAHAQRSATAVLLSGALGEELKAHAFERCRHFFLYLIKIRQIEYLTVAANPKSRLKAVQGVEVKATDQIDDGFRLNIKDHKEFDKDDEGIVDLATTNFKSMDAAHFCNLGVKHDFAAKIDLKDRRISDAYAQLKVYAGNTRWLPQRVNIGPDRIVDVLHGILATQFLKDGKAICSPARIKKYVAEAKSRLTRYAILQRKKKGRGIAKCAMCYVDAYLETSFEDGILSSVRDEAWGWCSANTLLDAYQHLYSST